MFNLPLHVNDWVNATLLAKRAFDWSILRLVNTSYQIAGCISDISLLFLCISVYMSWNKLPLSFLLHVAVISGFIIHSHRSQFQINHSIQVTDHTVSKTDC
jgi:hypothetical protein